MFDLTAMNFSLITGFIVLTPATSVAVETVCEYGKSNCPSGFYCVHFEKNKDLCLKRFDSEKLTVSYPFDSKTKSICDQGNLSPDGNSHTWSNTAFALDLQGNRNNTLNKIYSGVDGTVIAFDGCRTKNDQCGLGFGNQIKVLAKDDFIVFYAHLASVKVKTGEKIRKGTYIGIEGDTGWTGVNNRHLHLSVHYGWKSSGFEYWKNVGYLPPSVPLMLSDCNGDSLSSDTIACSRNGSTSKELCVQ